MTPFQIVAEILLGSLILVEIRSVVKRRTASRLQWLRLLVWSLGAIVIRWPETTIVAATWLRIGRGVDVVLYVLGIALSLVSFYLLHVTERHRAQITLLVRELAKQNAQRHLGEEQ